MKQKPMTLNEFEEIVNRPRVPADGASTCKIQRITTPDEEIARLARKVIRAEVDKRMHSGSEYDATFACGLSFALGAFSGVCEEKE